MKILVTGGRDYDRGHELAYHLDDFQYRDLVIIHGGAKGLDTLAQKWADAVGLKTKIFYADWDTYGKAAGPIRNQQMIDEGKPDFALVFPGGRGTQDMMVKLFKAGIPFKFVGDDKNAYTDRSSEES